jgi:hypothetical protein
MAALMAVLIRQYPGVLVGAFRIVEAATRDDRKNNRFAKPSGTYP